MNKTILVTGSTGFIGTHVIQDLRKSDKYKNCDLYTPDRNSIVSAIKSKKPDVIIHLAGNPSTKPVYDHEILRTNIELTHDVILAAPENCQIIFASTILVYGDGHRHYEKDPCNPTSVYAATKLAGEALINAYTNQGRIRGVNLRMSATVGSGMNHGALPELVDKVLLRPYVEAYGKYPGSVKPYTHIADVVSGIAYAITHELTGTYNLCTPDNCSIDIILDYIMELTRVEKNVIWEEKAVWKGDNPWLEVDNNEFKKTGFKFQYHSSHKAIKQAIVDILNQKMFRDIQQAE